MIVTTQIVKKKEKEKGGKKRTKERIKEGGKNTASYLTREPRAHACTQKALPCKRERIGYCHHTTTAHIRSRRDEGEIHGGPYVPRTEQRLLDDARREKCFLSLLP
jgi:hypothetical protein